MEHNPGAVWLTEAAKAAERQGPGNLLRIVLIVMVVGCVLVGWFLLRGYRQSSDNGSVRGAEHVPERGAGRPPRKDAEPTSEDGARSPESAPGKDVEDAETTSDKGAEDRNG
ncbi:MULTISPECIES: hypothetical protein [unclassified Streptomyces]|uniref:hypothetical protein n=1 Tax=unclassified Streptomyces TaxID=2593676 RepID=UPI0033D2E724